MRWLEALHHRPAAVHVGCLAPRSASDALAPGTANEIDLNHTGSTLFYRLDFARTLALRMSTLLVPRIGLEHYIRPILRFLGISGDLRKEYLLSLCRLGREGLHMIERKTTVQCTILHCWHWACRPGRVRLREVQARHFSGSNDHRTNPCRLDMSCRTIAVQLENVPVYVSHPIYLHKLD